MKPFKESPPCRQGDPVTIYLPPGVHAKFNKLCSDLGMRIYAAYREAVKDWITKKE